MTSVQRLEPARAYAPIAMSAESTVVAEFFPDEASGAAYQSESDLEKALLTQLQAQAYEYLPITTEADLVANLRAQLEALNGIRFSDTEWRTFFNERIASANSGIVEKAVRIQGGPRPAPHPRGRHHQNVRLSTKGTSTTTGSRSSTSTRQQAARAGE